MSMIEFVIVVHVKVLLIFRSNSSFTLGSLDLQKLINKRNYSEMVAWGVLLITYVIIIWQELFVKLSLVANGVFFFVFSVVKAIVMAQMAYQLTPEEKVEDTKEYFLGAKKRFFLLTAGVTALNLIEQQFMFNDERSPLLRLGFVGLLVACAFWDNLWMRWTAWVIIYSSLVMILVRMSGGIPA